MIGEKLKYYRKKYGYTQQQIAKELHISDVAYGDYERNKSEPDIKAIIKLCDIFNISTDELLNYKPENTKISFSKEEVDKLIDVINILNNKIQK